MPLHHAEDKLLILADEAVWGGFEKDEGVLKALITAEDRVIEHKGTDLYTVKNYARLAHGFGLGTLAVRFAFL